MTISIGNHSMFTGSAEHVRFAKAWGENYRKVKAVREEAYAAQQEAKAKGEDIFAAADAVYAKHGMERGV